MVKFILTSMRLTEKQHRQLKIMCVLTESTMQNFIRIAIQDKIDEIKKMKEKK